MQVKRLVYENHSATDITKNMMLKVERGDNNYSVLFWSGGYESKARRAWYKGDEARIIAQKINGLNLDKWKKRYGADGNERGGEDWDIRVEFIGGGNRRICGSNAYPECYESFRRFLVYLVGNMCI